MPLGFASAAFGELRYGKLPGATTWPLFSLPGHLILVLSGGGVLDAGCGLLRLALALAF